MRMLVPPPPSPVCLSLLRAVAEGWKQGRGSRQAVSWCSVLALSAWHPPHSDPDQLSPFHVGLFCCCHLTHPIGVGELFFNEAIPAPFSGTTCSDSFQTFMPSCSQKFRKHRQLPTRHRPCSVAASACTFSSMRHPVPQTPGDTCDMVLCFLTPRCLHVGQGTALFRSETAPGPSNRPSQRLPAHL